jgi:outer membrane murein-binding lipoprotein Lpp
MDRINKLSTDVKDLKTLIEKLLILYNSKDDSTSK